MNDIGAVSVLADDYDPVSTNVELIIGPWLLSMLAAWAVQLVAKKYWRYPLAPTSRESVFYGTWLFYLCTNIRFLDGEITLPALFILAFMLFPLPAFMIPCTVYYLRTRRTSGARSLIIVTALAAAGIAAQVAWIDYLMADASS